MSEGLIMREVCMAVGLIDRSYTVSSLALRAAVERRETVLECGQRVAAQTNLASLERIVERMLFTVEAPLDDIAVPFY